MAPRLMSASCAWQAEAANRKLPQKLEVLDIPQDDAWFRDSGPLVRSAPAFQLDCQNCPSEWQPRPVNKKIRHILLT